jgi:hypothetical protein
MGEKTAEKLPQRKTGGYIRGHRGRTKVHGMKDTPTHRSWRAMIARCYNPNEKAWDRYGGRGVRVCKAWWIFTKFLADMGLRPEGTTLDRWPDKDGNYEPNNCRWANPIQQSNNTRANIMLSARGETKTLCEWARSEDIPRTRIYRRLFRLGWSVEDAIFTPKLPHRRHV